MDDTIRYFTKHSDCYTATEIRPQTIDGAFKKTLEKWALIAAGQLVGSDRDTCGLCNKYSVYDTELHCGFCPICEYTGKQHCADTPYVSYYHAADSVEVAYAIFSEILFLLRMCRLYNTACRLPCKRTS